MTGELDCNTPDFIINYIANYCRIEININYMPLLNYYRQIINNISEYVFPEISLPLKENNYEDLKKVLRFISPYSKSEEWSSSSIILSFEHMMSFMSFTKDEILDNVRIIFGNKTNSNPFVFNEIIVYKICKILEYPICKSTSIDELQFFIINKYSNRIDSLRISLINKIIDMDETVLVNTFYGASKVEQIETNTSMPELPEVKISTPTIDSSILEFMYNDLRDHAKILNRITAKNGNEAILIAAKGFNMNITESLLPLKELEALRRLKKYSPVCNSFCPLYIYNKQWYNIKSTWCKILSPFIYTNEELHKFAFNEGFNVPMNQNFSSSQLDKLLRYNETINNFYFQRVPYAYNIKTTLLAEDINSISNNELICFGNISKREFIYLTVEELITFFKTNKIYIDPITSDPLNDNAIKKLHLYCSKMVDIPIYEELKNTLTSLDNAKKLLDSKFIELKKKLMNENEVVKEMVKDFFLSGIEMGLYMRGWKVNDSEYALSSQETLFENGENNVNEQHVFYNTVTAKNKLIKILLQMPNDISDIIKSLHALKFSKSNNSVTIFDMNVSGVNTYIEHTLYSCCTELIFGNIEPESSCIRTNSNWILFSFAWYSNLLGYSVPFKIHKIDIIS